MRSVEFRKSHNILYSAPIVSGSMGLEYKHGWSNKKTEHYSEPFEYVDLGSDGTQPIRSEGNWTMRAGEPSLNVSLADIKKHGQRFETDIVSPENTDGKLDLQAQRAHFYTGSRDLVNIEPGKYNFKDVIKREFPLGAPANVAWCVDASTSEFLVYTPK